MSLYLVILTVRLYLLHYAAELQGQVPKERGYLVWIYQLHTQAATLLIHCP